MKPRGEELEKDVENNRTSRLSSEYFVHNVFPYDMYVTPCSPPVCYQQKKDEVVSQTQSGRVAQIKCQRLLSIISSLGRRIQDYVCVLKSHTIRGGCSSSSSNRGREEVVSGDW